MDKRSIKKVSIIICIIWFLLTLVTAYAQTPTPNPDTLLQDCARNLQPDRPIPTGADAPSIKIIAPASQTVIVSDQATLADVTFTVEVHNWDLPGHYTDQEAAHWHLWLNDSVWGMFYQTEVLSGVPYGTWRMCASLSDANHIDIGMPDAILLTVERQDSQTAVVTVQPSATPATPSDSPSEQPPLVLIIVLGLAALVIGVLFGRRQAKSSSTV